MLGWLAYSDCKPAMALRMGDNAVLMAFCTSCRVAKIGLLLAVAPTGTLVIASRETGSNRPATKIIRARRDRLRLFSVRCGAVYLDIAVTSLNGLFVALSA